ncbi:MAG: HAMP domain-containing sensor histidine kinase, partial [Anaerovoracaceae bacterium]|nr:HAMP domain-containing sensor histidine kinase [Anaerovoracaceae bacterium]
MNRLKEIFQKHQLPLAYTGVTIGVMIISFAIMFVGRFLLRSIGFIEDIPRLWQLISLAFLAVVIGAAVAAAFSRIPLKPLRKIAEAADRLAAGDFSARINLKMGGELQELNTSFNNMANELEQSQMLRSDFINNFSHEFKTPITSIRGFAKMIREHNLSREETDEYLDIIIAESDRLVDLSANVLNLSKVENQTILTNTAEFNLSEQMRRVIVLLENRWEEKNLFINLNCSEVYINGNEEMLKQVWINLID